MKSFIRSLRCFSGFHDWVFIREDKNYQIKLQYVNCYFSHKVHSCMHCSAQMEVRDRILSTEYIEAKTAP